MIEASSSSRTLTSFSAPNAMWWGEGGRELYKQWRCDACDICTQDGSQNDEWWWWVMVTIVNNDNGVKTIPSTPDNESCDARDTVDQYLAFEAESFYNNLNQSLLCPLSQTGGRWKILISCDKEIRFPWIRKSQLDHHCRSGSDS